MKRSIVSRVQGSASIGNLTALTRLWLGDNQLTELPAAIGSLAALRKLYVKFNQLKELPATISVLEGRVVIDEIVIPEHDQIMYQIKLYT